ncbi:hypothetical protein HDU76_012962 [Blyttiomyces sp. JEL0837]|nr:hypothetical protein HDU76_012962 [Blyttiomyces sp. JEL0837]
MRSARGDSGNGNMTSSSMPDMKNHSETVMNGGGGDKAGVEGGSKRKRKSDHAGDEGVSVTVASTAAKDTTEVNLEPTRKLRSRKGTATEDVVVPVEEVKPKGRRGKAANGQMDTAAASSSIATSSIAPVTTETTAEPSRRSTKEKSAQDSNAPPANIPEPEPAKTRTRKGTQKNTSNESTTASEIADHLTKQANDLVAKIEAYGKEVAKSNNSKSKSKKTKRPSRSGSGPTVNLLSAGLEKQVEEIKAMHPVVGMAVEAAVKVAIAAAKAGALSAGIDLDEPLPGSVGDVGSQEVDKEDGVAETNDYEEEQGAKEKGRGRRASATYNQGKTRVTRGGANTSSNKRTQAERATSNRSKKDSAYYDDNAGDDDASDGAKREAKRDENNDDDDDDDNDDNGDEDEEEENNDEEDWLDQKALQKAREDEFGCGAGDKNKKGKNNDSKSQNKENRAERDEDLIVYAYSQRDLNKIQNENLFSRIYYSERYYDEKLEYRHVKLPKTLYQYVPEHLKNTLLSESQWRSLGVTMSPGWEHYMIHVPEPHILLFRREKYYTEKRANFDDMFE